MKKIIGVGIAVAASIVVVVGVYVFFLPQLGQEGDGKFTVTFKRTQATMEIGESQNFTITIVSTGYEGDIDVTDSMLSAIYTVPKPSPDIHYEFLPLGGRPVWFLQANGTLTLTVSITWRLASGATLSEQAHYDLFISFIGNRNQADEFKVTSETLLITVNP